jgi:ribose transport system substrate-binding protein
MKRSRRFMLITLLSLSILLLSAVALVAQDGDIVTDYSTDYLNDTTIAVPEGDLLDMSMFAKEPPYTIGFINWSTANSWTVQIVEEVKDEASLYPPEILEEFIVVSSEGDVDTQISQIEDMIVRGVDAILLIPVAPEAIVPAVEEAAEAGIPVVIFAADVNTDQYATKLLANPRQFGYTQGTWLMEALGCEGKIIVFNGITGISTSDLRRAGLSDAIAECPDGGAGIEILGEEDAAWAYDQGKLAAERFLAAHPEIDGVWSQGGAMTQGAIDAFEAAGRPLVPMTGEDNNGFLLAWQERMADGFKAMSASEPTWQSRVALQAALRILQGESIAPFYALQVPTIYEDGVADYVRPEYSDAYWANSRLSKEAADALYLLEPAAEATEEASE